MPERATRRWLSESAGKLLVESARIVEPAFHCDVLIVGSGYGGAVAAARLAGSRRVDCGEPATVFVLERGEEYLPGMFPAQWGEVPGHVRFTTDGRHPPRGERKGLFDIRVGDDVNVVLGNGLGGGSLINAAVMERASEDAFERGWPSALDRSALRRAYVRAETMLMLDTVDRVVRVDGVDRVDAAAHPPKLRSLMKVGQALRATDCRPVRLAISREAGRTPAGVPTRKCLDCGDCVSGCNHQAKHSLDVNYLALAKARGARLFCGGTVDSIARIRGGWAVDWYLTSRSVSDVDAGRFRLRCRKVVLAAGVLGSTEILLRSRSDSGLPVSARLGTRFSGNGDMIAAAHAQRDVAQCRADPRRKPGERGVGPTITGLARVPVRGARPIVLEEFAIPATLARIFDELVTLQAMAGRMFKPNWRTVRADAEHDAMSVDPDAMRRTMVYGAMGDDGANGVIEPCMPIRGQADAGRAPFDGQVRIRWPAGRDAPAYREQIAAIERAHARRAIGGHVIANPLWRPFSMELPFQVSRGPLTTVHPLGGCAMADNVDEGVVDLHGQVFDVETGGLMAGLAVLDGSIVPVALGINPALTIAALAEQAIPVLARSWGFGLSEDWEAAADPVAEQVGNERSPARAAEVESLNPRPVWPRWGRPADDPPAAPPGTRIRIRERSTGSWSLDGQTYRAVAVIEFEPIDDLAGFLDRPDHDVAFSGVALTMTPADRPDEHHEIRMSGSAWLVREEPSNVWERLCRALPSTWRRIMEVPDAAPWYRSWVGWIKRAWLSLVVATHVGVRRSMRYRFRIDSIEPPTDEHGHRLDGVRPDFPLAIGDTLELVKSIAFDETGNPWMQLSEGEVRLRDASGGDRVIGDLALDLNELASAQRVLLTVERQSDQPSMLLDLVGLVSFVLRATLQMHALSLLAPDEPRERPMHRLPGRIPGCPAEPAIFDLWSRDDPHGSGHGVDGHRLRLTRYRGGDPAAPRPILLIHGSGASGSTFAHPEIPDNAVSTLQKAGRDVWVLDLRTSIGFEQREPWWYDDVGLHDISRAVSFIRDRLGGELGPRSIPSIDVIAHCMGSAMLCAALLGHAKDAWDDEAPFGAAAASVSPEQAKASWNEARARCLELNEAIGSVVLSQVSPRMRMTPYNRFRGFVAYYLKQYLRTRTVDVIGDEHSFSGRLLDAFLMTFPYPADDGERDRAKRVGAFRRVRHRADWIFGQLMHLPRVADRTLPHLASIFGWVGIEMLMQAMAFSRRNMLTDADGRNQFLDHQRIAVAFDRPVLFLQGERNAIFDWRGALSSLASIEHVFGGKEPEASDDGVMLLPSEMSAKEREQLRLAADGDRGWWVNREQRHCVFIAKGFGHMDCLIGEDAGQRVLGPVLEFLDRHASMPRTRVDPTLAALLSQAKSPKRHACSVDVPQVGPIIGRLRRVDGDRMAVRLCLEPRAERNDLQAVLLVPRGGGGADDFLWRHHLLVSIDERALRSDGVEACWGLSELRTFEDIVALTVHADFGSRPMSQHRRGRLASFIEQAWELPASGSPCLPTADVMDDTGLVSFSRRTPRSSIRTEDAKDAFDRDRRRLDLAQAWFKLSARVLEAADERECGDRPGPPEPRRLVFAVGSCMYPAGLFDRPVAEAAYARLAGRLAEGDKDGKGGEDGKGGNSGDGGDGGEDQPGLMLLLGDQVYVDDTAGLFEPSPAGDRYSRPYALTFELDAVRDVMRRLPVYPILDDHEVVNDWEYGRVVDDDECRGALSMYQRWQHQLIDKDKVIRNDYRYWLRPAGIPLVVLDTRSGRSGRALGAGLYGMERLPRIDEAQLIRHGDLDTILDGLKRWPDEMPKLIASSSVLFPLRHEALSDDPGDRLSLDDWGGYPATWTRVLHRIHEWKIRNVIFVAGDLHASLVASMRLHRPQRGHTAGVGDPEDVIVVHSIVSSGLHAPWPFANTRPEELLTRGGFQVPGPPGSDAAPLQASIDTHGLSTGGGFAIVRLEPESVPAQAGTTWRLTVTFDMSPAEESSTWTRTLAPADDGWHPVPCPSGRTAPRPA